MKSIGSSDGKVQIEFRLEELEKLSLTLSSVNRSLKLLISAMDAVQKMASKFKMICDREKFIQDHGGRKKLRLPEKR